jgi:hypothetical protein
LVRLSIPRAGTDWWPSVETGSFTKLSMACWIARTGTSASKYLLESSLEVEKKKKKRGHDKISMELAFFF